MIQMDANTRELEKKTRDMGYSSPGLLYNASSSSFFIYLFFCERLITLMF